MGKRILTFRRLKILLILWIVFVSNYSAKYNFDADSLFSYYPNQIGNKWFYIVSLNNSVDGSSAKLYALKEILKDTIIDGRVYKKILNVWDIYHYYLKSYIFEYLDSTSGQLFQIDYSLSSKPELITDFHLKLLESTWNEYSSLQLMEVTEGVVFNERMKIKTFYFQRYQLFRSFSFGENIGLVKYNWSLDFTNANYNLLWCKIKNIVYGDTLLTTTSGISSFPHNINLKQNYPNPFNPTTTIEFALPDRGNVELKIYDLLGKDVITLVNEEKEAGNYKIMFDGSKLSSGTYYYTLYINGTGISNKMILLK